MIFFSFSRIKLALVTLRTPAVIARLCSMAWDYRTRKRNGPILTTKLVLFGYYHEQTVFVCADPAY